MPGWLDKVVDHATTAPAPHAAAAPRVTLAAVPRQSAGDYLREQAAAFDPRSFEGIANLAATFFPGPHPLNPRWGSRFVGKLNPSQRLYLNQLHNIERVPGQKGYRYRPESVEPRLDTGARLGGGYPAGVIAEDPNMGLLNYLMGFARGDPLGALEWQFPTQMWRAAPGGKGRANLQKGVRKRGEDQDPAPTPGKTIR